MVLSLQREKWIHSEESLISGKVIYQVKFVGKTEVDSPRGMDVVDSALHKLKFMRDVKRAGGEKPPKVEMIINIYKVTLIDQQKKEILGDIPLNRISFCADDKQDKRLFSFIAKDSDGKHYCYGLDSLHQANSITVTIGQAFELAYENSNKLESQLSSQTIISLNKRIDVLEKENFDLRYKILELESSKKVENSPERTHVLDKDAFDMQPFATPSFKLPSPKEVCPPPIKPRHRPPFTGVPSGEMKTPQDNLAEIMNQGFSGVKEEDPLLDLFDPLRGKY